jgi:nucleoside-diphosphate-sugar epimerase
VECYDPPVSENPSSPSDAPRLPVPLDELGGRKVLLTGGTGFIGRHLARRLVEVGAQVVGTTRREPGELSEGKLEAGVDWQRVDLADFDAVDALVTAVEPEIVLHLASYVAGSRALELVLPTFHGNLASTVHLLTAAEKVGSLRRFVQVGSLEEPDDDQPAPVPSSPYAAAKAAASAYARMFHLLHGTPVVLARVFMVYGPGPQDENKLVPYVIRTLLAGDDPSLSSGVRPVDWVYVDDVVEGLMRLALTPGLDGQRVDLGTGSLATVRELVEELYRQLAPERSPDFGGRGDRKAEQVRKADVDATLARLGWCPRIDVASGLARTIEYFRQH